MVTWTQFACPSCLRAFLVVDAEIEEELSCPHCGELVDVEPEEEEEE